MPGTREFAELSYTLTDCIVAAYNKTANSYSTPIALADGQMIEIEAEADTDQLRSYGKKKALLTVTIGAKIKVGAGGVDFDAFAVMTGMSNYTSGLTPNQKRTTRVSAGGAGLPYFGVIGVSATDDGGLAAVGLQCCKLNAFPKFMLDGNENKFNMSETEGYAVPVAVSGNDELMQIETYELAANWTAPNSGANFLTFFSA